MYDIYIALLLTGLHNMINIYNITKSLLCLCTFAGATTWGTENLKELLNNKHNKAETAPPPPNYLGTSGLTRTRNNKRCKNTVRRWLTRYPQPVYWRKTKKNSDFSIWSKQSVQQKINLVQMMGILFVNEEH